MRRRFKIENYSCIRAEIFPDIAELTGTMRTVYYFPAVKEAEHRAANSNSFWIAFVVAVLPFMINFVWGAYEGKTLTPDTTNKEFFIRGVTDLAFAGVIIAVSTFTNTYFAYARLTGWKSMSWETFASLLMVSVIALFNFASYLQVTHAAPTNLSLIDDIFYLTIMNVVSCVALSYVAHYSLLRDEFRNSRDAMQILPTNDVPPR